MQVAPNARAGAMQIARVACAGAMQVARGARLSGGGFSHTTRDKMSSSLPEFQAKFRIDELLIHRSDFWSWSVRPVPCTLGAGILSLNRFATSFADMTAAEATDLGEIVRYLDHRLHEAFAPDKMNYLMLMMVDRHLHFHVIPRYSGTPQFGGLDWRDSAWPKPPALGDHDDRTTSPVLLEIRDRLRG
jgi:diadenosine tetraphosphate (Ap4A) HIT family hydrolase